MKKSNTISRYENGNVERSHIPYFLGRLSCKSVVLISCLLLLIGLNSLAQAADAPPPIATPASVVGDIVTNPATGLEETVIELIADLDGQIIYVVTDAANLIFTLTNVGDTFRSTVPPDTSTAPPDTNIYQIVAVTENAGTELVESVSVNITTDIGADPAVAPEVRGIVSGGVVITNPNPGDPEGTDFTPPV